MKCGGSKKPMAKPMAYKKGGMVMKPCAGCPNPSKCRSAGKCMKKGK